MSFNPAAAERARYYVSHFGSADAALKVVDLPGRNDAFDREVCTELRTIRHAEATAALAAKADAPTANDNALIGEAA